ncbi:MAG: hypothetical protein ABSA26_04855 [Thermoguttaceae bacterium]|jgi:hypothetical protein
MFTGLMLIAWSLAGEPSPSASDDLKQEIRRLVHELDSDELAQRNAAEEALIGKGPAALDLLPEPTDRASAEVRERLARVRQKLQQAAVLSSAKPSLITLDAESMPLSKVLSALEEQSGNKIVDYRERFGQSATDPALKVHFHKTPFWQALDQVLDQANLTVYPFGDEPGLNIVERALGQTLRVRNAVYAGPFRFEPTRLDARRDLSNPKASVLRLTIEAAWEPRLKPISLVQRLSDVQAVDDRSGRLNVESEEAEIEVPAEGLKSAVELTLPFALPPREVNKITRVKGKITASIPGRIEEFRFDDLLKAKNVEKHLAGVTVTLEQVRRNNDAWEVFVRARFDEPGDALASHRGWIFRNEAYLQGADGKPIAYDTMETTLQTKNEVGVSYIFVLDKPPANMKFVYKTPGAIIGAGVEYELRDLKLP